MDYVAINGVGIIEESILGRSSKVIKTKKNDNRNSMHLHISDYSEVFL